MGSPGGSDSKESACNAGNLGSIPGLGRSAGPTPVFLPGEFHGQRSLAGYSPWHDKESEATERLTQTLFMYFWLCWVFFAACRLSLVAGDGGYSVGVIHGLSSCASQTALPLSMWDLPGPGIEPCPWHQPFDYQGNPHFAFFPLHNKRTSSSFGISV